MLHTMYNNNFLGFIGKQIKTNYLIVYNTKCLNLYRLWQLNLCKLSLQQKFLTNQFQFTMKKHH